MAEHIMVPRLQDLGEGEGVAVTTGDRQLALFLIDGQPYAIDDTCTHEGGPLSEGTLDEAEVECPWHGACFDVTTGQCLSPPAEENEESYAVRVAGDEVQVAV